MKGSVITMLCAVALTRAAVVLNQHGCPVDTGINMLLPHENCARFYKCINGIPLEMSCPPGLHFSAENSVCDFPSAANCHNAPKQICATAGSDGEMVAHENCNQFYLCSSGRPIAYTCPAGLLFDPTTSTCGFSDTVTCGDRVIPGANNDYDSQAAAICAAEGSDATFIAHEICSNFYICMSGHPMVFTCAPNTLFNPTKAACDFAQNVDCGNRVV
ncbi:peritrophin-1-like [Anticarsia gemmatalis]|uniref:peritrophin-1-like n=1 Tax=Anticarsia gemmatalis TaxID=129554 RepID=UPI003F75FA06